MLRPQPRGKTSNRPSLAGKESKIILDSLAESLKCPGGPVVGLLAEQGIHEAPEPRKARPTPGSACEQGRALRRRMILVLAGAQSSAVNSGRALGLLARSPELVARPARPRESVAGRRADRDPGFGLLVEVMAFIEVAARPSLMLATGITFSVHPSAL